MQSENTWYTKATNAEYKNETKHLAWYYMLSLFAGHKLDFRNV